MYCYSTHENPVFKKVIISVDFKVFHKKKSILKLKKSLIDILNSYQQVFSKSFFSNKDKKLLSLLKLVKAKIAKKIKNSYVQKKVCY